MILNLISRLLSSKDDEDYRSAGACPPRTLERSNGGERNPLACACGMRGPSPYGERGGVSPTVARGPVPRECPRPRTMARETRSHARVETCEGPSPTRKGCRFFTVARGPVPRERWHGKGQPPALRISNGFRTIQPLRV